MTKVFIMKRKYLFLGIVLVLFTSYMYNNPVNERVMNRDYVPDAETAVKVAEAIWLPIYGGKIYDNKPFVATLKDSSVWIVEGTLKSTKGGVPYIEIQKSDCKILKVFHGK